MSEVIFDEDNQMQVIGRQIENRANSKMGQWLVDHGLAAGPKAANIILVSVAVFFFSLSVFFFARALNVGGGPNVNDLPQQEAPL